MAIIETGKQPVRRNHGHEEANIQIESVRQFRERYPEYRNLLFAVPNENEQSKYEGILQQKISGNRRRMRGVTPGVSDLLLLVPSGGYHGLCLECKTATGRQSEDQKRWEKEVCAMGYCYRVFRSAEDLMGIVEEYLGAGKPEGKCQD